MKIRSALASTVLCIAATCAAMAQPVFKHSEIEFTVNLPAAYEAANQEHNGDLFIYFFREGDSRHVKMDSLVFSDERLSRYVNDNYAAFAANIDTEVGGRLLEILRQDRPFDGPFIAVINRQRSSPIFFHGWENVSPWLDDYGLDSNGRHWLSLVSAKEFGALRARPGEEGWGRWSARVNELISNYGRGR